MLICYCTVVQVLVAHVEIEFESRKRETKITFDLVLKFFFVLIKNTYIEHAITMLLKYI